jgi:plasmid maintenance system antidote protein VapI
METTNSTNKNNALTSMMEAYQKQLSQVTEFYTNIYNSFSGQAKNMWNPMQNQSNLFFNNEALKSVSTPFNGFGMNGSNSNPFEKIVKQVSDYNQNLMGSLTKQFDHTNLDGKLVADKYKKLVEERADVSKEYINTLAETFNKQMESTLAMNKKLQEETNKQFESVLKLTQEFFAGVLNTNQTSPALSNFSKDGAAVEIKKDKMTVKN